MNIIAIDIGNSRIAVGACVGGKVLADERVAIEKMAVDLPDAISRLKTRLVPKPALRVVVASVNPPANDAVRTAIAQSVDWPVLFVGSDVAVPIELDVDEPGTVGMDRVVMAAAAYDAVKGAVVVASLGTALTINAVDQAGRFVGGVICPGLSMGADALHGATALLPRVTPAKPAGPLGRTTERAIQAGLFYQAAGTIREVVEQIATQFGQWPHLVLTGGDAGLLQDAYEFFDSVVPNLSLMGINVAYRKHVEKTGKR